MCACSVASSGEADDGRARAICCTNTQKGRPVSSSDRETTPPPHLCCIPFSSSLSGPLHVSLRRLCLTSPHLPLFHHTQTNHRNSHNRATPSLPPRLLDPLSASPTHLVRPRSCSHILVNPTRPPNSHPHALHSTHARNASRRHRHPQQGQASHALFVRPARLEHISTSPPLPHPPVLSHLPLETAKGKLQPSSPSPPPLIYYPPSTRNARPRPLDIRKSHLVHTSAPVEVASASNPSPTRLHKHAYTHTSPREGSPREQPQTPSPCLA